LNKNLESEEAAELRAETDSVHSDDQDVSSNIVETRLCEEVERADDLMFDDEFSQDAELMRSMGLPLSFTQASERRWKKVCIRYMAYNIWIK